MKTRSTARARLASAEALEPRLALAVTVTSALPDITVPAAATVQAISVAGRFDDTAVTGTVVRFNVNAAAPNDRFFVELFDTAGAGRTRSTPQTVANFLSYVVDGSYANTIIHRNVPGFIVQGGGFKAPTANSNEAGGSPTGVTAKQPVVNEPGNSNVRGTIAMAKIAAQLDTSGRLIPGTGPDSATNQWFFNLGDNSANLDRQNGGFTAFGRVLGAGMTAVDALAAVPDYRFVSPFENLPLRDAPVTLPDNYVVQPAHYVKLPSIVRVGELVYSATSSDPSLVTASFTDSASTSLQLNHVAGKSGTATITVRATSVFDPNDFTEDQFVVTRQAPTAAGAPTGLSGTPGNALAALTWTAPVSNGGAAVTDYVVEYSSNGGSSWTTFADGTSTATRATVTGLVNGTSYVFRVAAVTAAGTGAYSSVSAAVSPRSVFAVGAEIGFGSTPVVRLVDGSTGGVLAGTLAFESTFRGGARVALGDLDGDGVPEVVAASGPGRAGEIRVFRQQVSGATTTLTEVTAARTFPFGTGYTGGVEVAVGDLDGDRREDLVAAMSRGAGTVAAFRSVTVAGIDRFEASPYRAFTPFAATFDGGATVAVADVGTFSAGRLVNAAAADGKVEIVVGSGAGMRPTVRVYDVSAAPRVVTTILPFPTSRQFGVAVTTGHVNNDAIDDIVVSAGRGGGSVVRIYNGRVDQASPELLVLASAFASLARPNAPVFTAPIDLDGNGTVDRFFSTQGDVGGSVGVIKLDTALGRVGSFSGLAGPFRIATPRSVVRA